MAARVKAQTAAGGGTQAPASSLKFIPTGSTLLDLANGGGWPIGRMSNIVGGFASGKTLLAIEGSANFARKYPQGKIWYRETESAFDQDYAAALGMPLNRISFVTPKIPFRTIEDFQEDLKAACDQARAAKVSGLYIVDSLDALSSDAELERERGDKSFGAEKAKELHQLFRKLVQEVETANIALVIISQVKDKMGVVFGKKETRTGGHGMDFYASLVIWLDHIARLKRTVGKVERVTGVRVRAKNEKNKVGLPFREAEFVIRFSYGIDDLQSNLEWLEKCGRLKRLDYRGELKTAAILDYADELNEADHLEFASMVADTTRAVWGEIETDFIPTRKKYT